MSKPVKCFIVEGVSRDYRFVKDMSATFFKGKYESVVICLPAAQNIYMLYEKMVNDSFETDLIELLREDIQEAAKVLDGITRQSIDEVYLFFDYDIHQDNLLCGHTPLNALYEMINYFDNETENGKLYISYPMVEAVYDYKEGQCDTFTKCWYPLDKIGDYKMLSGKENAMASRHFLKYNEWRMIIAVFGLRIECLFDLSKIDYVYYSKNVTVKSIYERQKEMMNETNSIFILSAFPEFLLDYFRRDFWTKHINRHNNSYDECPKIAQAGRRQVRLI